MIGPRKHLQTACGNFFLAFETYPEVSCIKPAKRGIDPPQERGIGAQSAAHHFAVHQGLHVVERVGIIFDVDVFAINDTG